MVNWIEYPGEEYCLNRSFLPSWLSVRSAVGKVVLEIANARFPDYSSDRDEGPAEVVFSDGSALSFVLGSDGESVNAEQTRLPFPPGGWLRILRTRELPWSNVVQRRVVAFQGQWIRLTHQGRSQSVVNAWRLVFEDDHTLTVWNDGDDARLMWDEEPDKFPADFVEEWLPPTPRESPVNGGRNRLNVPRSTFD
jgi:hypothetical protein